MDIRLQYTLVGVIVLLAVGWMLFRARRQSRHSAKGGGCCGCALSDACIKKKINAPAKDCPDNIPLE